MQTLPAPRELILEQLDRMLASDTFAGPERSRVLLKFLVEHVLENQPDRLKEYTIGSEALGRGDSFDPRIDPIVRAEASRLRNRIDRYYATKGVADTVLITLPKGSYVPQLQIRAIPEPALVPATAGGPLWTPGRLQRFMWFVLGGITVGAAVTLFVWMRGSAAPTSEVGEVEIIDVELGTADRSLGSEWGNDVVLSPDGTRIVFVARGPDHMVRLMMHRLGQRTAAGLAHVVELQGTEGARAPFFSPDGVWVGFWAEPKLKKVPVDGGNPTELTEASNFGGATWGDDYIIASIDGALRRVSETSGESRVLVADLTNDMDEHVTPLWPHLLPGGRVLFTAVGRQGPDAANIQVLSIKDGKTKPLNVRGTFGRYLPDGYLLYVNQGTLFAAPFDPQQLTVQGRGAPILERVAYSAIFGFAQFDISPQNGRLIYRRSPLLVASWLERDGGIKPLLPKPGAYTFPRLSRDGHHLAINIIDSGVLRTEIHDLRRLEQQPTPLPFAPGSMSPVWHPNDSLVLGSRTEGMSWMELDHMTKVETLTPSANVQIPWSFDAKGTRLAYLEESAAATGLDLWTVSVSHSAGKLTAGAPELFQQTPYFESAPSFSLDGRWLAYGWGPKGNWEVYVRPFPPVRSKCGVNGCGDEIQVSQRGGRIAQWLPGGREIVYRTDDQRLMVVDYQVKNGMFIPGTPKEWTQVRLGDTGVISNFDVYRDRILGLVPEEKEAERTRNQATVRLRFSEEIRRRLSRGGK